MQTTLQITEMWFHQHIAVRVKKQTIIRTKTF